MDGDIVHINKNLIGSSLNTISEISSPILSGYGLYSIFGD